ncbi:MAG: hypothetical protein V1889_00770 [archaeon]
MIELGTMPIIQVPEQKFGFCSRPDLAGKTFFEAFKEELKQYDPEVLKKALNGEFHFDSDGTLRGSNFPLVVLMNYKNLFPEGEHLLSITEFGQAFNKNPEAFKGIYVDTGIVARTANDYFSENILKQIKARGKTPIPEEPIVISNTDLIPIQDKKSRCGFVYKIKDRDGEELILAPAYGTAESTTRFTFYDAKGIAIPCENGKHIIYKRNSGVSGVCSDGQVAFSNYGLLADSCSDGRVAVGDANVPQNIIEIKKLVKQEEGRRAATKKDLEERIAKL